MLLLGSFSTFQGDESNIGLYYGVSFRCRHMEVECELRTLAEMTNTISTLGFTMFLFGVDLPNWEGRELLSGEGIAGGKKPLKCCSLGRFFWLVRAGCNSCRSGGGIRSWGSMLLLICFLVFFL